MSEVCIGISAVSHGISAVFPRMLKKDAASSSGGLTRASARAQQGLSATTRQELPPPAVAARPTGGARMQ